MSQLSQLSQGFRREVRGLKETEDNLLLYRRFQRFWTSGVATPATPVEVVALGRASVSARAVARQTTGMPVV
ncbi:hypothetical protein NOVOSPHI9U_500007 [Novosphingobium sp. 9U]|nr:hypothetical protein NOVOSPHI9U_500007 [Novosphingobium sp. 9U]